MTTTLTTQCQRGAVIFVALVSIGLAAPTCRAQPACDDGNPCTADSVNAQGGCDHTPLLIDCDDGSACTRLDRCNRSGVCVGTPLTCDDGNPCTTDTCDSVNGCQFTALADGTTCADSDPCNGTETCVGGTCSAGTALNCDDQNACTTESCVPGVGCVGHAVNCDDGNVCNGAESCDPLVGCQPGTPLQNGSACDDGLFCNGTDTCQSGTCSHSGNPCSGGAACNDTCTEGATLNCFSPAGSSCSDDGMVCTGDACNGAGVCLHTPVADTQCPKGYAILRWPDTSTDDVKATLGWQGDIKGRVCADLIDFKSWSKTDGDALALKSATRGYAVRFVHENSVFGIVATGGGHILGIENAHMPPSNATGGAPELVDCHLASSNADLRRASLAQLAATQTFATPIEVAQDGHLQLPVGPDVTVIDAPALDVKKRGTLQLVGAPNSNKSVIIRVHGPLTVHFRGRIELQDLEPEQVLFVVDGPIVTKQWAVVAGTLFGAEHANLGWQTKLDGQLVASVDLKLRQYVTINLHPWQDW